MLNNPELNLPDPSKIQKFNVAYDLIFEVKSVPEEQKYDQFWKQKYTFITWGSGKWKVFVVGSTNRWSDIEFKTGECAQEKLNQIFKNCEIVKCD